MDTGHDWTRRAFLESVSAAVPTLRLMLDQPAPAASKVDPAKFTPIDLSSYFTGSSADFGPRQHTRRLGGEAARDGLIRMPAGKQNLRGLPFLLGPAGVESKSWLIVSKGKNPWSTAAVEVAIQQKAGYICLAQFCDWDENESPPPNQDVVERVGQHLADVAIVYADGGESVHPIRRRFEVNSPSTEWGHLSFAALAHAPDRPQRLTDPLGNALEWGLLQMGVLDNSYSPPILWVCALANPSPEQTIKSIRLAAASDDPLVVCGLTVFHGRENPLRYERLKLYRITLPEAAEDASRWKLDVDLGVIARSYRLSRFEPSLWLAAPDAGLGSRTEPVPGGRHLYAEVTASPEATLWLEDTKTGREYRFELGQVGAQQESAPLDSSTSKVRADPQAETEPLHPHVQVGGAGIEILETRKTWIHAQVVEKATQRPTPVRLAFRSSEGRYIPPYGHRTEINDGWFQDYGADVKLMDSSFAYVDGTFQVELPVGDVYVEMTKGFEWEAVRRRLRIEPGQRELKLEIGQVADLRSRGWVSADTHVHFLSPTTALLEGQAEGLNLINLLAAQWGDLFTNVGDITNQPLLSRDGEMMVWVGTENRQHILGHLALLGPQAPVFPMSASGPDESYLGDPLWNSLAEWSDACRQRGGLTVGAHFPYPTAEIAADVVLGKIDALEIWPQGPEGGGPAAHFNNLRFLDWYRYLNCGYRLPAVGGTDKMGAYMPAGTNRAYAFTGQQEFTFANWAKAVRGGNTFVTSGPLLLLQVDGHFPGEEITLSSGGGTVEVQVKATSFVPFHRLEIVVNGQVVASRDDAQGTREMAFNEKTRVAGPGWLAARCSSRLGPVTNWEFKVQAHTSPVYFVQPPQELFSPVAAAYMLTLIEGAQVWAETLATRPDPERFSRVLNVFADARERLHQRLHERGIEH